MIERSHFPQVPDAVVGKYLSNHAYGALGSDISYTYTIEPNVLVKTKRPQFTYLICQPK